MVSFVAPQSYHEEVVVKSVKKPKPQKIIEHTKPGTRTMLESAADVLNLNRGSGF